MNADKEKALLELAGRNPFWICLAVFAALACDQGFRLGAQWQQRSQLTQARTMQQQNLTVLYEAQQLETRLQRLSLELLQLAKTNTQAKQIVLDFNIQWTPAPGGTTTAAAGPASAAATTATTATTATPASLPSVPAPPPAAISNGAKN